MSKDIATLNHPSELTKYYDECRGVHRYTHKGSGVVRDSLMVIVRWSRKTVATKTQQAAQKTATLVGQAQSQAAKTVGKAKQAAAAAGKKTAERGSAEIQAVLHKKSPN